MQDVDSESPATMVCERCRTPFHHGCWVFNDRTCAVFGCVKTDIEEEERKVGERDSLTGTLPMASVVLVISGLFVLFFLMMTMRICDQAA